VMLSLEICSMIKFCCLQLSKATDPTDRLKAVSKEVELAQAYFISESPMVAGSFKGKLLYQKA